MKKFKFCVIAAILLFLSDQSLAQLAGYYTIDPSKAATATNYKSFTAAISDLNKGTRNDGGAPNGKGVSDSVVFWVANGTIMKD